MKSIWYWIKRLKTDIFILYYASKHPWVSRQAKTLILLLAAYIISPIDLLPDYFVPGLGYIDDLILIPFVTELVIRMIPDTVVSEARLKARNAGRKTKIWTGAAALLAIMLLTLIIIYRFFNR